MAVVAEQEFELYLSAPTLKTIMLYYIPKMRIKLKEPKREKPRKSQNSLNNTLSSGALPS